MSDNASHSFQSFIMFFRPANISFRRFVQVRPIDCHYVNKAFVVMLAVGITLALEKREGDVHADFRFREVKCHSIMSEVKAASW